MSDSTEITPSDTASASEVLTPAPAEETIELTSSNVGSPDPNWPDHTVESHTCDSCGAENLMHSQEGLTVKDVKTGEEVPALEARHPVTGQLLGVDWECTTCGFKNNIGGEAPKPPDLYVLECGHCHSTFAPSKVPQDENGEWTCEVCSTRNKNIHAGQGASATLGQKVSP